MAPDRYCLEAAYAGVDLLLELLRLEAGGGGSGRRALMNSRSSFGTRGLSVSGCTKFDIKISLDTAMESFRRCRWDSLEPVMHRSKVFLDLTCAARGGEARRNGFRIESREAFC